MEKEFQAVLKAAREMVETVDQHDPDELLAIDNDPHPPSAINVAADNLHHAIERFDAFMSGSATY